MLVAAAPAEAAASGCPNKADEPELAEKRVDKKIHVIISKSLRGWDSLSDCAWNFPRLLMRAEQLPFKD